MTGSIPDPRAEALRRKLRFQELQVDETAVQFIIEAVDAADEASGVRRVTAKELAAIRADERQRFHVPQIAEARTGFGVFCAACSAAVGDYIYPCKLPDDGYWSRIPNSLVAADSPVGGVS